MRSSCVRETAQEELEHELREAARLTRDPRCVAAVDTLNLRIDAAAWGVGYVELEGSTYQPTADGEPAFIVAAEAGGELVDLVAVRLVDRAMAARRGLAAILGEDAIEIAHKRGAPLLLYDDAMAWMAGGFIGAVLLDWRQARTYLADLPAIWCANDTLARRVHDALTVPSHLPEISFARAA